MILLLLSLIAADDRYEGVLKESCEQVEFHYFYDGQGKICYRQLIFWDWTGERVRRLEVFDYRVFQLTQPVEFPEPHKTRNGWIVVWHDGEHLRAVYFRDPIYSHCRYDPELEDRINREKDDRRGLRLPPKPKPKSVSR